MYICIYIYIYVYIHTCPDPGAGLLHEGGLAVGQVGHSRLGAPSLDSTAKIYPYAPIM